MKPCRSKLRRKTLGSQIEVLLRDLVYRPADGKSGRDDGAGGSTGDQIEVVAEAKRLLISMSLPQLILNLLQDAQG